MDSCKALLIEDCSDYYNLIALTLRNRRINVRPSNKSDVLRELAEGNYNIVILSLDMSEHLGYVVLNKIRRHSNVPILAYTEKTVAFERINALNEGADDVMSKPIESEELFARINALLRRSDNMPQIDYFNDVIRGNLFLSVRSHSAAIDGKPINMTNLELSVAHFLISHPQKVYSKSFLFNRFWDESSGSAIHTVDAHIYNIRLKLSDCNCGRIKTIRNAGYKFESI